MYRLDGLRNPGALVVTDVEGTKENYLGVWCPLSWWRWRHVEAVPAMADRLGETNVHPGQVPRNYVLY